MLTLEGCKTRQERLWKAVPDSTEWLLIADPRHVNYFCGFLVNPISFSHGERALLVLDRQHGSTLIGDNFSLRSAASSPFVDREIATPWYDHKHSVINRDHALFNGVKQISEQLYGRNGAVEAEWCSIGAFETLAPDHEAHSTGREPGQKTSQSRALDLGTTIRELRRKKEPDEIALLKSCMRACEAGHQRAREVIKAGMTEIELYCEVQQAAVKAAGKPVIVYGDFRACTANNHKAGGPPTSYALQNGDIFVLDYTVMINGYRSDFTNALCVGKPSAAQQELFNLCHTGMQRGEKLLKAGVTAADVYRAVQSPYVEAGRTELFGHHAGHGLGLGHPEAPILVPESTDTLQAGDVITLEPGAYQPGVGGIRIEHNYLITESGYERLSNHVISLN